MVDCRGRRGDTALLWSRDVNLSILNYSHCHIDAIIENDPKKGSWFFAGVYGFLEISQRFRTWELLCSLGRHNGEPWLVIGDFNKILYHHEIFFWGVGGREGRQRPNWQISTFRNVVNDCALRDLGFRGNKFTWSNRREAPQCTIERLDRALANIHWWGKFPNASVTQIWRLIQTIFQYGSTMRGKDDFLVI